MCSTSTLEEIQRQHSDIERIRLKQRFLDPIDLLTRYKDFHCNCEALTPKTSPVYLIHHTRAKEFSEVLQILEGDLDNG